jgi:hypothetical protein
VFGVSGFGFAVSDLLFRVHFQDSGFGLQIFGFRVLCFVFGVSGLGFMISGFGLRASDFRVSGYLSRIADETPSASFSCCACKGLGFGV